MELQWVPQAADAVRGQYQQPTPATLASFKRRLTVPILQADKAGTSCNNQAGFAVRLSGLKVQASLPLSLSLSTTRGKHVPDLQVKLIDVHVSKDDSNSAHASDHQSDSKQPARRRRVWHAKQGGHQESGDLKAWGLQVPLKRLCHATAALAISYLLLPDTLGHAITHLSWPGYIALTAPLVWNQGGMSEWRISQTVCSTAAQLKHAVRHSWSKRRNRAVSGGVTEIEDAHESAWAQQQNSQKVKRSYQSNNIGRAALAILQLVTGPAALLHLASNTVRWMAPQVHLTLQAAIGLMAVTWDYSSLSRRIRQGRLQPGEGVESAWHAAHKRAARRVARYCGPLPHKPPLAGLIDVMASTSFQQKPYSSASCHSRGSSQLTSGGAWSCLSLSLPCWPFPSDSCSSVAGQNSGTNSTTASASTESATNSGSSSDTERQRFGGTNSMPDSSLVGSNSDSTVSRKESNSGTLNSQAAAQQQAVNVQPACIQSLEGVPVPQTIQTDRQKIGNNGSRKSYSPRSTVSTEADAAVFVTVQQQQPARNGFETAECSRPSTSRTTRSRDGSGMVGNARNHDARAFDSGVSDPSHCAATIQAANVAQHVTNTHGDQPLMLYGRSDHLQPEVASSITETCALLIRSIYLLCCFLPFLTLGIACLVLYHVNSQQQSAQEARNGYNSNPYTQSSPQPPSRSSTSTLDAQLDNTNANRLRRFAWQLLLHGCRTSGAAFCKWGQWAATRGDLFPPDFCDVMSSLHDAAPVHSLKHTKREVLKAFGQPLEALFQEFESQPLASGSVAQVHKAVLAGPAGLPGQPVAVKVRHPNVATAIGRDFKILKPLAGLTSRFRMLKGLNLKETLAQFSATMTAQTDLRVEAAHLARAGADFASCGGQVVIPRVMQPYVSPSVLVESWEEGRSVAAYCKRKTPINTQLVSLGVDAYLAMLLKHNFVHTDLHPGNILVRMVDEQGCPVTVPQPGTDDLLTSSTPLNPCSSSGNHATEDCNSASRQGRYRNNKQTSQPSTFRQRVLQPQLVLLDYGLAEELTPDVRHHFISFLNCIPAGNGALAAHHILHWAKHQQCPDHPAFKHAMHKLFQKHCNIHSPEGINLDFIMKSVLRLACLHEVSIDSSYAALAVAVCVLVGFATSLDETVNLMDAATPCLLAYSLTGRVVGRLYS